MRIRSSSGTSFQTLRGEIADVQRGDAVVAHAHQFFRAQLVVAGRLQLLREVALDAVIAEPDVLIEPGDGEAHAANLLHEFRRDAVVLGAHQIVDRRAGEAGALSSAARTAG